MDAIGQETGHGRPHWYEHEGSDWCGCTACGYRARSMRSLSQPGSDKLKAAVHTMVAREIRAEQKAHEERCWPRVSASWRCNCLTHRAGQETRQPGEQVRPSLSGPLPGTGMEEVLAYLLLKCRTASYVSDYWRRWARYDVDSALVAQGEERANMLDRARIRQRWAAEHYQRARAYRRAYNAVSSIKECEDE